MFSLQPGLGDHYITASLLGCVPLVYIIVVVLHQCIRKTKLRTRGGDGLTSSL